MRVLAALLALLVIGACGGDPQPKEPKPPASATPTVTVPTMPASAREDTPGGAANFALYFVAVFNHAAQTGDSQPMTSIARNCKPCNSYADDFKRLKSQGGLADGPVWSLSKVSVSASRHPIEVDATLSLEDGSSDGPYRVTFVLNSKAPFAMRDLKLRDQP
jgi:hypothetical protein